MVSPMHIQSIYSAILGLSSNQCVSDIMHGWRPDGLEINLRSKCPSIFPGPMRGVPAVGGDEEGQRRTHKKMLNEQQCMDAIAPLVYL